MDRHCAPSVAVATHSPMASRWPSVMSPPFSTSAVMSYRRGAQDEFEFACCVRALFVLVV